MTSLSSENDHVRIKIIFTTYSVFEYCVLYVKFQFQKIFERLEKKRCDLRKITHL